MAIVGYLEGTDPLTLTRLNLNGIGTTPLGNSFDGHGKYVGHITKNDRVTVVVGYLHKILPTGVHSVAPPDFLNACHVNNIPVLLVAPEEHHDKAAEMLGEAAEWATLVSPDALYEEALKLCQ
jgi:hypothetical protein